MGYDDTYFYERIIMPQYILALAIGYAVGFVIRQFLKK